MKERKILEPNRALAANIAVDSGSVTMCSTSFFHTSTVRLMGAVAFCV